MTNVDEMVDNLMKSKTQFNINPEEKEINQLDEMLNDDNNNDTEEGKEEEIVSPSTAWKFEDVTPIYRHGEIAKYETKLSARALAILFRHGRTVYKGDVQRGVKFNKKGDPIDVYSPKKVKEIYNAMLEDKIHGGLITLNYSKDNETPLEYDEEDGTIKGLSPLDISDGSHRIRACNMWANAYERNPEAIGNPDDFEYIVAIENLTDEEAKGLFAEYALTPKKISVCRAEYLNVLDNSAIIARRIIKESQLQGKVELVTTSIKGKPKLIITFSTLTQAIRNNFKPATKAETDKIASSLVRFVDELIETFPGLMGSNIERRAEERTKFLTIENIVWNGYFATFAKIIERKDWKHKINRLNNNVTIGDWKGKFLSRENPMFSFIYNADGKIINNTSVVSRVTKIISEYAIGEKNVEQIMNGEEPIAS